MNNATWLLPEGVEEILPEQAAELERLRRATLDELARREFQLVMPPVMEFVDSLLTGTGEALDTQTYKFMDQHTHRMLGIRADMTPQIARIDAHYLASNEVNKLCYAGTVLRTQPEQMGGQRELLQVGAEIFGVTELAADLEVIDAMLATLNLSTNKKITLSLGHVGIYRALLRGTELPTHLEPRVFDTLLRKSLPDLKSLGAELNVTPFLQLLKIHGDIFVLDDAAATLAENSDCRAEIDAAVNQVRETVVYIKEKHPHVQLHIDLADVFGYRYHTGLKFAAYVDGQGRSVAKGGRYDRIGEQFGYARPATGFSADLKSLIKLA